MKKSKIACDYYETVEYNDDLQGFISGGKYNFLTMKPKLMAHFEDGGSASNRVLAGVLRVSNATISEWRNPNSRYYKRNLHALVDELSHVATAKTDQWHRESASGRLKDANAQTLNRRAEKFLGMNEVQEVKHQHTYNSTEEIDAEIAKLHEEQENE